MATAGAKVESTTSEIAATEKHFRFLDLPPELRLHIYSLFYGSLASNATKSHIKSIGALLQTNSRVLGEAAPGFLRYEQRLSVMFWYKGNSLKAYIIVRLVSQCMKV